MHPATLRVVAGREVVRHPAVASAHDDIIAAVAGAITAVKQAAAWADTPIVARRSLKFCEMQINLIASA
jgi:hypothetical protein